MDPLHLMEVTRWKDLKETFKIHWPNGITGYYALDYLEKCLKINLDYGFKVWTPYGEAKNGIIVVLKDEKDFLELLIECPQEDTSKLSEALKNTKIIDNSRSIVVLFPRKHVMECLKRTAEGMNMNVSWVHTLKLYILDKNSPLFDIRLPEGVTFGPLTEEHTELANSTWPHRYPGSIRYFQLLIRSKLGYGLFKADQLIAFGFIKEMGALGHLYTLEEHRRKGYINININKYKYFWTIHTAPSSPKLSKACTIGTRQLIYYLDTDMEKWLPN